MEYGSGPSKERMMNSVFSGVREGSAVTGAFLWADASRSLPECFYNVYPKWKGNVKEKTQYIVIQREFRSIYCVFRPAPEANRGSGATCQEILPSPKARRRTEGACQEGFPSPEASRRTEGAFQQGFPCFFLTALKASSAMSHVL
jgi:hypothetical protein